jgi:hypothetical protein
MPWQIDLAILWKRVEKLTYPEIVERLVQLFGEEVRVTEQAVQKRILHREKQYQNDNVIGKRFESAESLDDETLLNWMRSQLYMHTYAAASTNDAAEMRRNADVLLKVMRAKKDLVAPEQDESDKAAAEWLKQIQGIAEDNQKVVAKEIN